MGRNNCSLRRRQTVSVTAAARTSATSVGWVLVVLIVLSLVSVSLANSNPVHEEGQPASDTHENQGEHGENIDEHGEGGNHSEHGGHRYHVAAFDFQYVKMHFVVAIWILYAGCAKIFFHMEKHLSKIFPESCMLILIGIGLGLILYFTGHTYYELNTTTFFLVLLPPIILDAGYYMPARPFFDQLGTILLYAVLGTLLNTIWLGFALWGVYEGGGFNNLESPLLLMHALVLGSLLAAVDPVAVLAVFDAIHVNDILYIVVFGESLLNDGISVVLYHVFEGFSEIGIENIQGIDIVAGFASFFVIVFGATGIGIILGLIGGFISRFTRHVRIMEPLIVYVIGYISFLLAEMFHLSGILSCTFCGITMRKYVEANLGPKSKSTIKTLLKMAATVSEIIIFMYLGISAVSDTHHWDTAFCILTLVFCLIFRAIGVIVLTFFANLIRVVKLTKIDQFVMAYGGLRGAIAFALVVLLDKDQFPHRRMFITSTVLVIYFTNLAMGTTIKPLVQFLKVKTADHSKPSMGEKMSLRFMDHIMAGVEDVADQQGHHLLRERFSYINNKWLKPLIVGRKNPQRRGWQIWHVYNRLNEKTAREVIRSVPSSASLTSMFRHASELDLARTSSSAQLVPYSSAMNRSGSFDSWIHGPNGSVPFGMNSLGRTGTVDSLVQLDVQTLDAATENRRNKPHHGAIDSNHGPKLQSTKEQVLRSVSRENTASPPSTMSSTTPRLYVPRRQTYSGTMSSAAGTAADFDLQSPGATEPQSPTSPDDKTHKNVSFEKPPQVSGTTGAKSDVHHSIDDQLPGVITFTTRRFDDTEPTGATSAELSLPWKRPSSSDEPPLQSHALGRPGRTPENVYMKQSRGAAGSTAGTRNAAFVSDDEIPVSPYDPSSSESSQETEDTNTNNNNSNVRRRSRRRSRAPPSAPTASVMMTSAAGAPPLPVSGPPGLDQSELETRDELRRAAVESIGSSASSRDADQSHRGTADVATVSASVEMHQVPAERWRPA